MTLAASLFSHVQIARARAEAAASGRSPAKVLQDSTGLDARETMRILALTLNYPYLDTTAILDAEPDFGAIPVSRAIQRGCIALNTPNGRYVAISNPFDVDLLHWVEARVDTKTHIALATEGDIKAILGHAEESVRAVDSTMTSGNADASAEDGGEELSLVAIAEDASPIVRLVNSTLYDALKAGASDIHFESTGQGMEVKYRVDGVLDVATVVPGSESADQAISRIKVLAELDISERRIPQDGRFRVSLGGRTTDLRVSIMPSIHGEDAVLRILDKRQLVPSGGRLTLDVLGFDAAVLTTVRHMASEPYGMLLVTGPTGSGKTTTLYAAISETFTGQDKIITIEDPVEYELKGVLQIPVNEKKGLSFARGLRSILRHDPDKIMVGEIRDAETAEIAVQSALTGHLVLSTVHANSVFDVFNRFTHMGVDPHALASALNGVWAQRLLRTVCPHCASPDTAANTLVAVSDAYAGVLGVDPVRLKQATLRAGRGCGECRGTGFKGRKAIAEVLVMTDAMRELITEKASIIKIKELARANGTRFLREAALDLALRGETTLEEVQRVTLHGAS